MESKLSAVPDVAAIRERAEYAIKHHFDTLIEHPATVLALIDAAYDDTGQPWRDRAEAKQAEFVRMENAWRAEVEKVRRERDEALERVAKAEQQIGYMDAEILAQQQQNTNTAIFHEAAKELAARREAERDVARATIDRVRALADEWEGYAREKDSPQPHGYAAADLRRVLAGDQDA